MTSEQINTLIGRGGCRSAMSSAVSSGMGVRDAAILA
jgi:hypothetical protein